MPKYDVGKVREKYLAQTKAFRLSRATWTKARFISLSREVPMTKIIAEAVDDLFNREFPDTPSDSKKVPDEKGEILSHHDSHH